MIIEIKGVQFVNKGAELMLHAILDKINEYWPHASICMVADQNSPIEKRTAIGALQKVNWVKNRFDLNGLTYFIPKALRRLIQSKYNIVTEADVDVVLDASGFLYSEQWNYLPLKQTSLVAERFKRKQKHFVLMPQALGPFKQENYKAAARTLFTTASLTFARDSISYKQAKTLCSEPQVQMAPDFTNVFLPSISHDFQNLKGKVAFILNSKMVSKQNKSVAWREKYLAIVKQLITIAQQQGEDVFLLNHEGEEDLALCNAVNQELSQPLKVISPESCTDIKAIIGQCKWVMSSRFHGCVSALSQEVPCLATSWSHKYEMLFADYEHTDWLIDIEQSDAELNLYLSNFISEHEKNAHSLAANAIKIKELSNKMWNSVRTQINTK